MASDPPATLDVRNSASVIRTKASYSHFKHPLLSYYNPLSLQSEGSGDIPVREAS